MTKDKTDNKVATKNAMADYGIHVENVMENFDTNKDSKISLGEIKKYFRENGKSVDDTDGIQKLITLLKKQMKGKKKKRRRKEETIICRSAKTINLLDCCNKKSTSTWRQHA